MKGGLVKSRRGTSLAELLVALVLLAVGGSLATRLLMYVGQHVEGAELGLRATLFLGEMRDGSAAGERLSGPGRLVPERSVEGVGLRVHFEPSDEAAAIDGLRPRRGYRTARTWSVGGDL